MYQQLEIRSFDSEPTATSDGRHIEGYAIVFGQRSQVMYDPVKRAYFEETIAPEAVSLDLIMRSDVKALLEHNYNRLLARSKQGKGSLELSIDQRGLKYRFEAPNTTDGNDALELVRRGDLCGSSFGFYAYSQDAIERTWDKERKIWLHQVRKIDKLVDVTITSNPAYTQTSVEVRSLEPPTTSPEPKADLQAELRAFRARIPRL